ncbi:hypothetical protein PROFUN_12396 [Planoprotostelium fungivorum]|uniref:Uncharacterized protein n=1 Tax=Planoprotostelium fungivorum TaxID=1890364 RepID=A0A2P6N7J8_9EUKA|nr:hypothetical protein PROFUN_12396 [Planoprotostelium fungivorum]
MRSQLTEKLGICTPWQTSSVSKIKMDNRFAKMEDKFTSHTFSSRWRPQNGPLTVITERNCEIVVNTNRSADRTIGIACGSVGTFLIVVGMVAKFVKV